MVGTSVVDPLVQSQGKLLFRVWNERLSPGQWALESRAQFARETQGIKPENGETKGNKDTVDCEAFSKVLAQVFLTHAVVSDSQSPLILSYQRHSLSGMTMHSGHLFLAACPAVLPTDPPRFRVLLELIGEYGMSICDVPPGKSKAAVVTPQDMSLSLLVVLEALVSGVEQATSDPLATSNARTCEGLICSFLKVNRMILCLALARKYHPKRHDSVILALSKVPHSDILGSDSFTSNGFMNQHNGYSHRLQSLSTLLPRVLAPASTFIRSETMASLGFEGVTSGLGRVSAHVLVYTLISGWKLATPQTAVNSVYALLQLSPVGPRLVFEQLLNACARMCKQQSTSRNAISFLVSVLPSCLLEVTQRLVDVESAKEDLEGIFVSFARASRDVIAGEHLKSMLDLAIEAGAITLETVQTQLPQQFSHPDPHNTVSSEDRSIDAILNSRTLSNADVIALAKFISSEECKSQHLFSAVTVLRTSDLRSRPRIHGPVCQILLHVMERHSELDHSSLASLVHMLSRDWLTLLNLRGLLPLLLKPALLAIHTLSQKPFGDDADDRVLSLLLALVIATSTRFGTRPKSTGDVAMRTSLCSGSGSGSGGSSNGGGGREDKMEIRNEQGQLAAQTWEMITSLLWPVSVGSNGVPMRRHSIPEEVTKARELLQGLPAGQVNFTGTLMQLVQSASTICALLSTSDSLPQDTVTLFDRLSQHAPSLAVTLAAVFASELTQPGLWTVDKSRAAWTQYTSLRTTSSGQVTVEVQDVVLSQVEMAERRHEVIPVWSDKVPELKHITSHLCTVLLGTCEYSRMVLVKSSLVARLYDPVEYAVSMLHGILSSMSRSSGVASEHLSHIHAIEFTAATVAPSITTQHLSHFVSEHVPLLLTDLDAGREPVSCYVALSVFIVNLYSRAISLGTESMAARGIPIQNLLDLLYDAFHTGRYVTPSPRIIFSVACLGLLAPTCIPRQPDISIYMRSAMAKLCARDSFYTTAFALLDDAHNDDCVQVWIDLLQNYAPHSGPMAGLEGIVNKQ